MQHLTYQLVLSSGHVGDIHVVGGRAKVFILLVGKNIKSNKMHLCVTVLASLGSRHVNDLAGAVLDNNKAVFAESRALHGVSQRRAGVDGIECDIMLKVQVRERLAMTGVKKYKQNVG